MELSGILGAGLGFEDVSSAAADSVAIQYVEADTSALIGIKLVRATLTMACLGSGASAEQCVRF